MRECVHVRAHICVCENVNVKIINIKTRIFEIKNINNIVKLSQFVGMLYFFGFNKYRSNLYNKSLICDVDVKIQDPKEGRKCFI